MTDLGIIAFMITAALVVAVVLTPLDNASPALSSTSDRLGRLLRPLLDLLLRLSLLERHLVRLLVRLPDLLLLLRRRVVGSVQLPAGTRIRRVLAWLFSPKTMVRIFDQSIADMREEAIEDEVAGRHWHRRWVIVRGHIGLGFTGVAYLIAKFGKTVAAVWKLVG